MGRETIKIEGKIIELSHLDKVFWPKLNVTKGQMVEYYVKVAPYILPFLKNRPLSMKRYPDGVAGEFFFEKNAPEFTPKWIRTKAVKDRFGKITNYILVNDLATLVWVANLACIEFHAWLSVAPKIDRPDTVLFDLDPTETGTFEDVSQVALLIKKILDQFNLPSFAKTTGMRGMHVQIPIKQNVSFEHVRNFVRVVGEKLAELYPEFVTLEERKEARARRGKVFIDWTQNAKSATAITPYSLRASNVATVACPVSWNEVKNGIDPVVFTLREIDRRLKKTGSVWKGYGKRSDLRCLKLVKL